MAIWYEPTWLATGAGHSTSASVMWSAAAARSSVLSALRPVTRAEPAAAAELEPASPCTRRIERRGSSSSNSSRRSAEPSSRAAPIEMPLSRRLSAACCVCSAPATTWSALVCPPALISSSRVLPRCWCGTPLPSRLSLKPTSIERIPPPPAVVAQPRAPATQAERRGALGAGGARPRQLGMELLRQAARRLQVHRERHVLARVVRRVHAGHAHLREGVAVAQPQRRR
eukprot:7386041-Prymnesium_polylepis.2